MSAIPLFLPWQVERATAWLGSRERFAHAWLIHGLAGIGKRQFVLAAAASLLCEAPQQGLACGHCAACQWIASGSHPDLRLIRPDAVTVEEGGEAVEESAEGAAAVKKAPSKEIRVDQLRALATWFNTATHRSGWRVAVLYPAEALNSISANALLKVLEEPPAHTVFLIVADAPDRLLPTLVSRCRRLPLPVPSSADSVGWLREQGIPEPDLWLAAAGAAPLLALSLAQSGDTACPDWIERFITPLSQGLSPDIGALADMLEKQAAIIWIDNLQRLCTDLLLAALPAPVRYFPGLANKTLAVASRASPLNLAEACQWLAQQRALAGHPLNAKLLTHATLQRIAFACGQAR
jgi:DNA polymerase-3 subunit delta'